MIRRVSLTEDFIEIDAKCPDVCGLTNGFVEVVFRRKVKGRSMEFG